ERRLRDEERIRLWRVERLEHLAITGVDLGELSLRHAHGVRLEGEADRFLAEEAEDLLEDLVEHGDAAKSGACCAVGRVFPGAGVDLGEGTAWRSDVRGIGHVAAPGSGRPGAALERRRAVVRADRRCGAAAPAVLGPTTSVGG